MDLSRMCPNCFQETYNTSVGCTYCGYVYNPPPGERSYLPPFTMLNEQYLVGRVLGSGGFGITYKAYDIYNNQLCAVKEFMPSGIAFRAADYVSLQLNSTGDIPIFQHAEKRFIEEAMILMQLHNVENVIDITDYFYANSTAYFVMPFVDGCHLKELYRRLDKRIPYDLALQFIYQIGSSLIQVHEQGKLLHRDISPENIMIDVTGKAILIDFGNARTYISEKSQNMSVLLKPGYAPPEQYSSRGKQGPWTDVYSLAATYYFVVAGTPVPEAPDRLQGTPCPLLDTVVPGFPSGLALAIDAALRPNLAQRTQSMREFITAIRPYVFPQSAPPAPAPEPAPPAPDPPQPPQQPQQAAYQPYLEIAAGEQRGTRWLLPPDVPLNIGRSANKCHIVLSDYPQVSSLHCVIAYVTEHQLFIVQDVSTNGVKLDGQPLTKNLVYTVKPGQQLSLAGDSCVFRLGLG